MRLAMLANDPAPSRWGVRFGSSPLTPHSSRLFLTRAAQVFLTPHSSLLTLHLS